MNQLPSTAVGTIRLLAATQTEVDIFSDAVIQSIKEGHTDPLEVLVYLKAFEKVSERIIKETKQNQLTAAELYTEVNFKAFGADISKADTGTKYDYSVCNDPVWNHRSKIAEEAKSQLSERETFLKTLKTSMTIVDDESGGIVTISPPKKAANPGLKVFIK